MLYSFGSQSGDGAAPAAGLIEDTAGAFYGTTSAGGTDGVGTVFELTPPTVDHRTWTETTRYAFTKTGGNGQEPMAALCAGAGGILYGTTAYGGSPNCRRQGCGVVFELRP